MDVYDIVRLQNIAFILTQNTAAQVELQAMLAANQERIMRNESLVYGEDAIRGIIDIYQLGHNAVLTNLYRGCDYAMQ